MNYFWSEKFERIQKLSSFCHFYLSHCIKKSILLHYDPIFQNFLYFFVRKDFISTFIINPVPTQRLLKCCARLQSSSFQIRKEFPKCIGPRTRKGIFAARLPETRHPSIRSLSRTECLFHLLLLLRLDCIFYISCIAFVIAFVIAFLKETPTKMTSPYTNFIGSHVDFHVDHKKGLHVISSYAISTFAFSTAVISTCYTFNRLQFQPHAISTAFNFNRLQFQPFAISTACNFNLF